MTTGDAGYLVAPGLLSSPGDLARLAVGARCQSFEVDGIRELLDQPDWQVRQRRIGVSTGLVGLDELTGGLVPGVVWIITGAPGVGLSVLARGFAASAALVGRTTTLICARDRAEEVSAAMVCARGGVSSLGLANGALDGFEHDRVARAVQSLGATSLQISGTPVQWGIPRRSPAAAARGVPEEPLDVGPLLRHSRAKYAEVVVIDDLDDLTRGSDALTILDVLRTSARLAPLVLIVTLPREAVMVGARPSDRAARAADVIVHLERDDQNDRYDPLAGEIDIGVVRNRYGPTGRIIAAYQGHYRRIVGMS